MSARRRPAFSALELEPRVVPAAVTELIRDINLTGMSSAPFELIEMNGSVYFRARDSEGLSLLLWRSDGTSTGTVPITNPDVVGTPDYFVNHNGVLFFSGEDPVHGRELWKYDGTNVSLVNDIYPGPDDSSFADPVSAGNVLFFEAFDTVHGFELWRTDGTSSGTSLVRDINPGLASSAVYRQFNADGTLFFFANDGLNGQELWRSDGTSAGTFMVREIQVGTGKLTPGFFCNADGLVFFSADDGINGRELWRSDGTSSGTFLARDIRAGSASSGLWDFVTLDGRLYFSANDGITGYELWQSDGTSSGTFMVVDNYPVLSSSNPNDLIVVSGAIYFTASDGISGISLWRSDGTSSGTIRISSAVSNPANLVIAGGSLFFTDYDSTSDRVLWTSDGTSTGTYLVHHVVPVHGGIGVGAVPGHFVNLGSILYFYANDVTHGSELWRSDGTSAGTHMVADLVTRTAPSNPDLFTNVSGTVFFTANDYDHGVEVWKTDGTSSGTSLVRDINPLFANYPIPQPPRSLTNVNSTLFFVANDNIHGLELWKSDGTSSGTVLVRDIFPGTNNPPQNLFNYKGILYFSATEGVAGPELWRSDGTSSGTYLVRDITPGSLGSYPKGFVIHQNLLYFSAGLGGALWRSDGTSSGTILVSSSVTRVANITSVNNSVYFSGNDFSGGYELWRSDGSSSGTFRVRDINPGNLSAKPAELTNVGGRVFFTANDGVNGVELWCSDGTSSGTNLVRNIGPGAVHANAFNTIYQTLDIKSVNGITFFRANDGSNGRELWKSDGTSAGTIMVNDIVPGTGGSDPGELTILGGKLYFTATTETYGKELWTSDGTSSSTQLVADIFPGRGGSSFTNMRVINGRIYGAFADATTGSEPRYVIPVPLITSITSEAASGTYTTGQTIPITVAFNESLSLTGGNLLLTLNSGATAVLTVSPFSGNSVTAIYQIAADHAISDLDVVSVSLSSGATLQDAAGNDALLILPVENLGANRNLIINPLPPTTVTSVFVNLGATQRSRLTSITLNFAQPVNVGLLTSFEKITLTKTAGPNPGTIVQTGATGANGRINLLPASGLVTSLTLTFENANGAAVTAGVENGSLSDGRWRLSIPYLSYLSNLNDPNLRRLFGDVNSDGTVDGTDLAAFGAAFGQTNFNSPFDFDGNGTVDAADYAAFGSRFGVTM